MWGGGAESYWAGGEMRGWGPGSKKGTNGGEKGVPLELFEKRKEKGSHSRDNERSKYPSP